MCSFYAYSENKGMYVFNNILYITQLLLTSQPLDARNAEQHNIADYFAVKEVDHVTGCLYICYENMT